MKVKVLRPFYSGGVAQKVGTVLDISQLAAYELVANHKAERVEEAPPVSGPMTTERTPELVQGKARKGKKEDE